MIRKFCDFCNAEIDDRNPYAIYDGSLIFEGQRVVLRVEFRNQDEDSHSGPMTRPDICHVCRMFDLKPEAQL